MSEYRKPWLSVAQQAEKLASRGVDVEPLGETVALLNSIGYYRLTGYMYPFRQSESHLGEDGHAQTQILSAYRPGTSVSHIRDVINFDRELRLLVMDGIERLEVTTRMRLGYILGRHSSSAHLDAANFLPTFTTHQLDVTTGWHTRPSQHAEWLARVAARRDGSDEAFVSHFREKYGNDMPIWALTELLELGQLSRLYKGLGDDDASEVANMFGVPTKKLMSSWLASLNYVRNLAAHHARLFNRRLQHAPSRPKVGVVPLLDHLRDPDLPKGAFGTYSALAVIAYLLRSIDGHTHWCDQTTDLLARFPHSDELPVAAIGVPPTWQELPLWDAAHGA